MHPRLVVAWALLVATAATAQPYPEVQRSSFYVATRDGTRLAVDLYRPARDGQPVATPLPVIWQHTFARRLPPDQPRDTAMRHMPELARQGYVVALVDRRGMGASFGARRGYNDRTEARDAYDMTEWLARQPWSSGQVGIYGCSNTGDAALHAATLMPPSLKAVFAGCFSFSKYDGFLRGGVLANWGSGVERRVEEDLRHPPVDGPEGPALLRQAVDEHRGNTPLATMWRSMPFRDSWTDFTGSRFWLEGSAATWRDAIVRSGVALYVFGGFDDDFRREGLVAFANLAPLPRKLTLGPWSHCRNDGFDLLAEAQRFFDHTLKGIDSGLFREPAVRWHVQGAPEDQAWRRSAHWPPPESRLQRWPLLLDASGHGEHRLGAATAPIAAPGTSTTLVVPPARDCGPGRSPFAQACSQAAQGLRFTSDTLAADAELVGHPLLQLALSSSQPEPTVFAYLEALAPDGQARVLSDARLQASLRRSVRPPHDFLGLPWHRSLEEDHAPLGEGEVVTLQMALLPVSVRIPAGHRLRLVLTGADPRQRMPQAPGGTLTLHQSAARPLALQLPVLSGPSPSR